MAAQIQLLCCVFLSALLSVSLAHPHNVQASNDVSEKVSVQINKLFDMALPTIRKMLLKEGLDPLQITDIFYELPGLITHNGVLTLTNGWLQGLSEITRNRDIVLSYENKILTINMDLGFDVLDVNYEYDFTYGLIRRQGDFHARLHNAELQAVLGLDIQSHKVILDSFHIVKYRKVDLKLEGHIVDPILNLGIKAFATVFPKLVTKVIEKEAIVIFGKVVDEINERDPASEKIHEIFDKLGDIPITYQFMLV